jgi:hypothetical protein
MKNKEKYYAVNNQEDEDGYTPYLNDAIYESVKKEKSISRTIVSPLYFFTLINTEQGYQKMDTAATS